MHATLLENLVCRTGARLATPCTVRKPNPSSARADDKRTEIRYRCSDGMREEDTI